MYSRNYGYTLGERDRERTDSREIEKNPAGRAGEEIPVESFSDKVSEAEFKRLYSSPPEQSCQPHERDGQPAERQSRQNERSYQPPEERYLPPEQRYRPHEQDGQPPERQYRLPEAPHIITEERAAPGCEHCGVPPRQKEKKGVFGGIDSLFRGGIFKEGFLSNVGLDDIILLALIVYFVMDKDKENDIVMPVLLFLLLAF